MFVYTENERAGFWCICMTKTLNYGFDQWKFFFVGLKVGMKNWESQLALIVSSSLVIAIILNKKIYVTIRWSYIDALLHVTPLFVWIDNIRILCKQRLHMQFQ